MGARPGVRIGIWFASMVWFCLVCEALFSWRGGYVQSNGRRGVLDVSCRSAVSALSSSGGRLSRVDTQGTCRND